MHDQDAVILEQIINTTRLEAYSGSVAQITLSVRYVSHLPRMGQTFKMENPKESCILLD